MGTRLCGVPPCRARITAVEGAGEIALYFLLAAPASRNLGEGLGWEHSRVQGKNGRMTDETTDQVCFQFFLKQLVRKIGATIMRQNIDQKARSSCAVHTEDGRLISPRVTHEAHVIRFI